MIRIKYPKNIDIKIAGTSNIVSIRDGKFYDQSVLELIFSDNGSIYIETTDEVIELKDAKYTELILPSITDVLKSQGYTIDILYNLTPVERDQIYYKILEL